MNQSNPLSLPGASVTVDKRFGRRVAVAIVDEHRVPAHGYEVEGGASTPQIHYRILRHGRLAIQVATTLPVEVRVMRDGELLAQQQLDPVSPSTLPTHGGSQVRRQVGELVRAPQVFLISAADDGTPLAFEPDPQGRSNEELMALQLPYRDKTPRRGPTMHRADEPMSVCEAVADIDPSFFGPAPVGNAPALPQGQDRTAAGDITGGTSGDGSYVDDAVARGFDIEAPATSTQDDGVANNGATSGDGISALDGEPAEGSDQEGSAVITGPRSTTGASGEIAEINEIDEIEADGGYQRFEPPVPTNWAPSYALFAIGVRMIQVPTEGEPIAPPDGFDWVLFQLNTFAQSAAVRANMLSHLKLPPRDLQYKEIDDGTDGAPMHGDGHCGCGTGSGIFDRRFKK